MYKFDVGITGIAPILFNRFTLEAKGKLDRHITGGTLTPEESKEEALSKVFRNKDGLYIPGYCLKAALLVGATKGSLKFGKKSLSPFLKALVFISPKELLLGVNEPDFIDERTGRRPPRTGGACIIRRPGLNAGWKVRATIEVMDNRLAKEQIVTALEETGLLAGLCDDRPEFGRFTVQVIK